eukprot:1160837-Pelagomonas_calceolata.AAC.4
MGPPQPLQSFCASGQQAPQCQEQWEPGYQASVGPWAPAFKSFSGPRAFAGMHEWGVSCAALSNEGWQVALK